MSTEFVYPCYRSEDLDKDFTGVTRTHDGYMSDSVPDGDPSVIGVNSEDAEALIGALSSDTARRILERLHDSPATPSEVAEEVDTTLQNTRYHLSNLEEADLISVHDTRYSPKGREMKVYGPEEPTVVFVGGDDDGDRLRDLLTNGFAGLLLLAGVSAAVEYLYRSYAPGEDVAAEDVGVAVEEDVGDRDYQVEADDAPVEEMEDAAAEAPGLLETLVEMATPGVLVFLGGAVVLTVFLVSRYLESSKDD